MVEALHTTSFRLIDWLTMSQLWLDWFIGFVSNQSWFIVNQSIDQPKGPTTNWFNHRCGDSLSNSFDWLVDLIHRRKKFPHGDDFRVGPKSDRPPRDKRVRKIWRDKFLICIWSILFEDSVPIIRSIPLFNCVATLDHFTKRQTSRRAFVGQWHFFWRFKHALWHIFSKYWNFRPKWSIKLIFFSGTPLIS